MTKIDSVPRANATMIPVQLVHSVKPSEQSLSPKGNLLPSDSDKLARAYRELNKLVSAYTQCSSAASSDAWSNLQYHSLPLVPAVPHGSLWKTLCTVLFLPVRLCRGMAFSSFFVAYMLWYGVLKVRYDTKTSASDKALCSTTAPGYQRVFTVYSFFSYSQFSLFIHLFIYF